MDLEVNQDSIGAVFNGIPSIRTNSIQTQVLVNNGETVVLGGVFQEKAALLVIVSKDLTAQCQAGKIIKEVAAIVGGSGGGRPDMAQAGGAMPDKLPEALSAVPKIIEAQISN